MLDGGLRLWVVGRSVLAKVLLPVALAAALLSFGLGDFSDANDVGFYGRAGLLVGLYFVGCVAGACVLRMRLDDTDLNARALLGLMARHWLALTVSLVIGVSTSTLTLSALATMSEDTALIGVFLGIFAAMLLQAISLCAVTAIVWADVDRKFRQLARISASKLLGLTCMWSAAIVVFGLLVVAWQVLLLAYFLDTALAPLGIDLDEWQSASRGFMLLLPAVVLLGPQSGGVWTLALIDESVRRNGVDLRQQVAAMEPTQ